MKLLLPIGAGLFALCLDLFLRTALDLDAWSPDLLVVIILWLGTARSWIEGALVSAFLGALADGFAGSPLGLHMLHAVLLFYMSRSVANRVLFQGFPGRMLLGLAGGLTSLAVLALISRIFLGDTPLSARLGSLVVPRVLIAVIAVPLVFPVMDRIETLFVRRKESDLL